MIITLVGADFSNNNINDTLTTWTIFRDIGEGATYDGPTSVEKSAALSATVTIDEGYEVGAAGVTVTMGGEAVTSGISTSGQVITISIGSVTGNVVIKVPTKNTATGEEPENPGGGEVVDPDTGDYPFDTTDMIKFDLSTAEWEQGTVGNTGATGTSPTRIRTKTPYSVPYDNVKFYVKVNSPYVGGLRSGTTATSTPLNQYWFSNDSAYGGGVVSTIPAPNIGWEITIPSGHTLFWPVLAVGDGTQTNNTTNILPADVSSTGFELWYVDKSKLSFSVRNYTDNVQVANCVESAAFGETVTATYTANSGFTLPDTIEVNGGTLSNWDKSTGVATITNVSDTLNITVSANRSDIPTDYTPVSYIRMKATNKTPDTQTGFSSGVIAGNTTGGEYCFKQHNANTTSVKTNGVYETSIADAEKRRWYMPYFEANDICVGWNDLKTGQNISDATQMHVASTNKQNCRQGFIDGVVINKADALEELTLESTPVGIGTLADNGAIISMAASNAVDCNYYWIKFWQDTTLVRDMVPVLRKSDNEPGFYDFVEQKFYTNEGAVAFTYA